jgi:hypothetical protein
MAKLRQQAEHPPLRAAASERFYEMVVNSVGRMSLRERSDASIAARGLERHGSLTMASMPSKLLPNIPERSCLFSSNAGCVRFPQARNRTAASPARCVVMGRLLSIRRRLATRLTRGTWLFIALAGWTHSAAAADPMAIWYSLSEADRAEIQTTLTERLPAVLPQGAQSYAQTLATEIPRWGALAGHLERGEYAPMLGLYADDLVEYVDQRFETMLPADGLARSVYGIAKDNPASLRKVLLAAADPNKSWDDVSGVLWGEVHQKVQSYSKQQFKGAVRGVINEVLGTSKIAGYTAGDLYLLAVESWIDAVQRFGEQVESAAANQLYRQYRLERSKPGGTAAAAEKYVRGLWETEFVPRDDGGRLPVSWTARLTRMGLGIEDFLPLYERYWRESEGRVDRFDEWLDATSRYKLQKTHADMRNAARAELEKSREIAQAELREAHAAAARELRQAIEQRLTDPQLAARDEAIRQAQALVQQMRDRNVAMASATCQAFTASLRDLEALDEQVRASRVSLRDLAFHIAESKRLAQVGDARAGLEGALTSVVAARDSVAANAAGAEQAAERTCRSAAQVARAPSQAQGRKHLDDTLDQARAAKETIAAAEQSIARAVQARDRFLTTLSQLNLQQRNVLREAQAHLQIVEMALADLRQRQALETRWKERYAYLASLVRMHETILGAFEAKAQRVEEFLAPHHANEAVDAVRREVENVRAGLACLRHNLDIWAPANRDGWVGRQFPQFDTPDPQALREAREMVASFNDLATLPALAEMEAAAQNYTNDVRAIRQRLSDAQFRVDSCVARAIVDYDRTWLTGDLTRVVTGESDDAKPNPLDDITVDVVPLDEGPSIEDLARGVGDGGQTKAPLKPQPTPKPRPRTDTPPPNPVEGPHYAVYGVHPWESKAGAVTPRAQPTGYMAFQVTGEVLGDYAAHQQRVAHGTAAGDFALFVPGGRYHQTIHGTDSHGTKFQFPFFLSFLRLENARPDWVEQTKFGFIPPGQLSGFVGTMASRQSPGGGWTFGDNAGNYVAGPIQYDGPNDWSQQSKTAATRFLARFRDAMSRLFE